MRSRFDFDSSYVIAASLCHKLEAISERMNHPASIPVEQRRDMANMIDLILKEVAEVRVPAVEFKVEVQR